MNKFVQRLASLSLSALLVLSSLPAIIAVQEPTDVYAEGDMTNNNMVWGTQSYTDLSEYNKRSLDVTEPNYQMLRFSLITTGEISDASRGNIYTGDGIDNNPVSIANPNGGLQGYNNGVDEYDKVRQLVNYKRYTDEVGTGLKKPKHVLNTRRDYTGNSSKVLFYDAEKTTVYDDPTSPETSGSHEEIAGYSAYFVPTYYSTAMPQLIAGGTARSSIQDNPPAGFERWKTMEPNEFFDEYTQASFIPTGDDVNIPITKPVPDCIYRILAYMLGKPGPYTTQADFDDVEAAYNNLIANGKCEILVEPLQCFKNTGEGSIINTFFNSSVKYVALSSAEVGMLDDNASGILYGYTDQRSLDTLEEGGNNYNFFTSPVSTLSIACRNLYNSLLLKESAWECNLWALSDGIDNGSLIGAGNRFVADIGTDSNFMTNPDHSTGDFGSALGGSTADVGKFKNDTADNISGKPGPYWHSIFYHQVYNDIYPDATSYDPDKAKAYNMSDTAGDCPDPASYINFGGMSIIKPVYGTIDIKTDLVGVGETTETLSVNGIETPIYEDSYLPAGSAAAITFKASMGLNFEDNATNWTDKVVTNIDNGDRSNGVDTDSPDYLYVSCATDDTQRRTPKDIGSVDNSDVYIPTYTKAEVTVTYVDADGNPITYTQANGEEGNGNTSIAVDPSTPGKAGKMFLDNIAVLGWHKDAANPEDKAIIYNLSKNNSTKILADTISNAFMIDAGFDDTTDLPNNITDTAQAGYITMRTPDTTYIPGNAAYFLVTLKANVGKVQTHSGSFESFAAASGGNTDLYLQSRPQYNKALADSGASVSTFYASYTDPGCPNYGDPVGSGVEIDYSNNTSQILIPIEGHDVSADSVSIIPSQVDVTVGTTTYKRLNSLCLETTGSATDATLKAYGDQKTSNTIYLFATTSPLDTSVINVTSRDELLNIKNIIGAYAASIGSDLVASTTIGGATNLSSDGSGSLRYIGGDMDDDTDEVAGDSIALWQICTGSSDTFVNSVNNKIDELVNNHKDPKIYLTAFYIINDKILDSPSNTVPPLETDYSNNTVPASVTITTETNVLTEVDTAKLSCAPVVGGQRYQLKEYTDYMNTGISSTSSVADDGLTNYSLVNSGDFQYGGTIKIDDVPNSWTLGRRTVLEYTTSSDWSWTDPKCSEHMTGSYYTTKYRGISYPSSWYRPWTSANDGPNQKPIGDGRVIAANQYLDDDGRSHYTGATQQILFKYLDLDTNKYTTGSGGTATSIENPNYYKFVVKTQIANYGFVTKSTATCSHGTAPNKTRRTKKITYRQYVLADTQDSVGYTIAFDHNYAQSINNSVCYSIDSFLAPSSAADQGKYSYIIEAGSRLGVALRERIITDMPMDVDIPVYADAYFMDVYPGTGSNTKMNQGFTKRYLLQLTDTAKVPLSLGSGAASGVEYNSDKLDTATSTMSSWAKSNASYSMLLAKTPELEEDLFTISSGNSSGTSYYAQANTAGAKYQYDDGSTCVPTVNAAPITSSYSVVKNGSGSSSYYPVLGVNCFINPRALIAASPSGWGVATGLQYFDNNKYEQNRQEYMNLINRFLMYKKDVTSGTRTIASTSGTKTWLHSTYGSNGKPATGSLPDHGSGCYVTLASGSNADYSDDFINVRYYKWEAPFKDGARGIYTDPDYPDSIKVDSSGQPTIANKSAARMFLGNSYDAVDNVDKEYGYCGLRIKLISYVASKTQAAAEYDTSTHLRGPAGSAYAGGLLSDWPSMFGTVKMGDWAYGYASGAATSPLIGDCTDFNLVVIGSTSNRYSGSSNY